VEMSDRNLGPYTE